MGMLPKSESAGWTLDPEFESQLTNASYDLYSAIEAAMMQINRLAKTDESLIALRDQVRTITVAALRLHGEIAGGPDSESDEDEEEDDETDDEEDAE